MSNEELINEAFKAMKNAYAPYSKYHVGACVLCKDGKTFYGANIENASYGATNCGERSAVFAAYSCGYRKEDIEAIAIVTDGERLGTPCGICRQVLSELLKQDTPILLSNRKETRITNINELLPDQFGVEDLSI
jgi:cytidine deaminase